MPLGDEDQTKPELTLDSINAIVVDEASEEPDDCTTQEQYEQAQRRVALQSLKNDTAARKEYAKKIFALTCAWVIGIYLLLVLQGFGTNGFRLADSVLLAAIGSTTANIIGVFLIVTRYFFPNSNGPKQLKKTRSKDKKKTVD